MKIFDILKKHEESDKINNTLTGRRLELTSVPLDQSGATTSPWAQVTEHLVRYKYVEYIN
jgi:hypothetical protein